MYGSPTTRSILKYTSIRQLPKQKIYLAKVLNESCLSQQQQGFSLVTAGLKPNSLKSIFCWILQKISRNAQHLGLAILTPKGKGVGKLF